MELWQLPALADLEQISLITVSDPADAAVSASPPDSRMSSSRDWLGMQRMESLDYSLAVQTA